MLAYRKRHRIAIQEKTNARDPDTGENIPNWDNVWLDSNTELDAVPAEVFEGPGRQFDQSAAQQASIAARITMDYQACPMLTQHMRILWDGRIFNIHRISRDATARREWRIECVAGVNQG